MVGTSPFSAGGEGSIPALGAKISHALWPKDKTEAKKFNCKKNSIKTSKSGSHQEKNLKKISIHII